MSAGTKIGVNNITSMAHKNPFELLADELDEYRLILGEQKLINRALINILIKGGLIKNENDIIEEIEAIKTLNKLSEK